MKVLSSWQSDNNSKIINKKDYHENLYFIIHSFLYAVIQLQFNKKNKIEEAKLQHETTNIQSTKRIAFENVKVKYDTLIPIFDGLFITHHKIDSLYYIEHSKKNENDHIDAFFSGKSISINTQKWGVIDSIGHVVVPFICDGVKKLSNNKGLVSVFSTSYSLNTGLPRYQYIGLSYFFTKAGIGYETEKEFSLKIEFIADIHNTKYVIRYGPDFFLPIEYRKNKR